ncbi:alpha/beta fold hydrolase [Usitatibacter palustris]|uniref:2-succinyl-6-hydroxy-2, 4-cyclohexadiene-1-carboxylate synthase n=1 Tax=Usitatibacter palustris TaxID=2732487 RepID=A0A6M4H5H3_9PROT|nr:alpha/beta hydrolase [Usitatibacter palustris]QJR14909.1 2-succinyl-6-hydroxy-2,4-cyclohexadiene-1-carboxylate synthase [Usitatibacter palustris]
MSGMRESSVLCLDPHGFHRIHYTEWGDPDNPRVVVCVHGLTRNARDFDFLAERLAATHRVICPDVAGRGKSDWLVDKNDYNYGVYLGDTATLLAKIGAEEVDWVGTSMGGLIGMILAGLPNTPIRRMVLNDVGSVIPKASLERIGLYLGLDPTFDSLEGLEGAVRTVSPFGELTAAQWRHLAVHVARRDPDGRWRFRYDPGIAQVFKAAPAADVDMRSFWNALKLPVLVIRGENSDLLLPETLEEMKKRPGTQAHLVPRTGHAPALMNEPEAAAIRSFLLA